jgi:hypothetical protein
VALGCVLCDGVLYARLTHVERDLLGPEAMGHESSRRVADVVHRLGEDGVKPGLEAVLDELSRDEAEAAEAGREDDAGAWGAARSWATAIWQRVELETQRSGERREQLLRDVVAGLREDEARRTLEVEMKAWVVRAAGGGVDEALGAVEGGAGGGGGDEAAAVAEYLKRRAALDRADAGASGVNRRARLLDS